MAILRKERQNETKTRRSPPLESSEVKFEYIPSVAALSQTRNKNSPESRLQRTKGGKLKMKSGRRNSLRDVSNRRNTTLKSANKKPQIPPTHHNPDQHPLDRLLLLNSHISSILRQIDELVVQAVNVEKTEKGSKEITSFADLLSDIHSSLKPWVSKLEKAVDSRSPEPKIESGESSGGACTVAEEGDTANTPVITKQDSLVSPSPLVSWRANDCTIEKGKQLFLLTPLPRPRTLMSKVPVSSKPAVSEDTIFCSTAPVSLHAGQSNHVVTEAVVKNMETAKELDFASPPNTLTPSLKNPPKSCVLLEPGCEFKGRKIGKSHKSTPYPIESAMHDSTDSDNSGNEVWENLGLKYPELVGIKPSYMFKNGTRALDASPAWVMSPPKSCILLEPPVEKPSKYDASLDCHPQELGGAFNQKVCAYPSKESSIQLNDQAQDDNKICCQGNYVHKFVTVESTPLCTGLESTVRRGKRPGENTLKKELWTKFEAATSSGFRLNLCVPGDASEKGFLDRLEEASCEEIDSHPDSLR